MSHIYSRAKTVAVRAYTRWRFGRVEHVRNHWRTWPGQLTFNFE